MKIAYQGIEGSYSESCAKEMYPNSKTIPRDHVSYSILVGDVSIGEIYETILDFEGDTVMLNKIYHNIFNLHQSKIKEGSLLNDTINSLSNTLNSLKTYSENYTFHNWLVPLYNTIILLSVWSNETIFFQCPVSGWSDRGCRGVHG